MSDDDQDNDIQPFGDWQDILIVVLVTCALTVMALAPVFAYKDHRIKQLEVAIQMHGLPLPGDNK